MLDESKQWDWRSLSFILPRSITDILQAIPFILISSSSDTLAWGLTKDDNFSLKSAYFSTKALNPLKHSNTTPPPRSSFSASWVLKEKASQRMQIFLWACSYNSIPVLEVLVSRGFNLDHACPICNCRAESIIHLLRDHQFSTTFGNDLGIPSRLKPSFSLPRSDWLRMNGTSNSPSIHHYITWCTLFLFGPQFHSGQGVCFEGSWVSLLNLQQSPLSTQIHLLYLLGQSSLGLE